MTPEEFFISEAIKFAKQMSYCDCLLFLHGFVKVSGDDNPDTAALRETLLRMEESDRQLELLASPQMQLPLDGSGGAK